MATSSVHRKRRVSWIRYGAKGEDKKRPSPRDTIEAFDTHVLLPQKNVLDLQWDKSESEKEQIMKRYLTLLRSTSNNPKAADQIGNKYLKNGRFDPYLADKFYNDVIQKTPIYKRKGGGWSIPQRTLRGLLFELSETDMDNPLPGASKQEIRTIKDSIAYSPKGMKDEDTYRSAKITNFKRAVGDRSFLRLKEIAKQWRGYSTDADVVDDVLEHPGEYEQELIVRGAANREKRNTYRNLIRAISGREVSNKTFEEMTGAQEESWQRRGLGRFDEAIGKQIAADLEYGTVSNWKQNDTFKAIVAKIQPYMQERGYKPADWQKALTEVSGGTATLSYEEVRRYAKAKPSRRKVEKWAEKAGIQITNFPATDEPKRKKKGFFGRGKSTGGSYKGASGMYSSTGKKMTEKPFFGKTTSVSIKGGEPVFTTQKSGARMWFEKRAKGLRGPTSKERISKFRQKYGEIIPPERYVGVLERGNFIDRWQLNRQAKKMATDPTYLKNQHARWDLEKGIAEAKLIRARKERQRQVRAATSTWYSGWYRFSKYTKWIAAAALVIAILFLPIGAFYVLGWALAVGIIALFQFIIWVFMEFWFLMAQLIVSIVGLIGQAFVMVINWVGGAFGGAIGQTYKPFDYQLVQNMLMFSQDSAGVYHVYQYTDTGGQKEILTWGALNLTPPSFLQLELFKPTWFDTSTIFGHIIPPVQAFFNWMYSPIAVRYTAWISDPATPWYWPGVIIGVPVLLIIIGIYLAYRFTKRRVYA